MMQRSSDRCDSITRNEQGAAMMLVVVVLLVLLAMSGLAIDGARLYIAQLKLQKAADVGVLGAFGHEIFTDGIELTDDAEIEQYAAKLVRDNIGIAGLIPADQILLSGGDLTTYTDNIISYDSTLNADNDPTNDQPLTAAPETNVSLFIMNAIPFEFVGLARIQDFVRVIVRATSERVEANVALILDYSHSMDCPTIPNAAGTYCKCLSAERDPTEDCEQEAASVGAERKVEELRQAVEQFVLGFDDTRDNIGLTAFNIAATLGVEVNKSGRGFAQNDFQSYFTVNTPPVEPTSNTNISDGIIVASQDMEAANLFNSEETAYVIFTDGAPTAVRLFLGDVNTTKLPEHPPYSATIPAPDGYVNDHRYDYTHYTIEWVQKSPTSGPPVSYSGPSYLIKTWQILSGSPVGVSFNYPDFIPSPDTPTLAMAPPTANVDTPVDGSQWIEPLCTVNGVVEDAPSDPNLFNQMFGDSTAGGCLNSFGFKVSSQDTDVYGTNYTFPSSGADEVSYYDNVVPSGTSPNNWKEQYFNAPIQLADRLRQNRGLVFVIGLGEPAPTRDISGSVISDEYQNVDDSSRRHDWFLTRLAYDYIRARAGSYEYPDFKYDTKSFTYDDDTTPWVSLESRIPERRGLYIPVQQGTDAELDKIFKLIQQRIFLRLIRSP